MVTQRTLQLSQFRPSFSQQELDDLQESIRSSRLPAETYASRQGRYGTTHAWMKTALVRWQDGFEWQKHEDELNEVNHYMTTIKDEGVEHKVHFIFHESSDSNAIPLMLLHGWPVRLRSSSWLSGGRLTFLRSQGSAFEFIEVIKTLRKSTKPAFHLIAPMEPGYGWSSPPPLDRGFNMDDCARLLDKLMHGLGFGAGYAVQGGDIGSGLARTLALQYDACKCINVNYLPAVAPPPDSPERKQLKPHEEKSLQRSEQFQATGRGYAIEHATRPSTIGMVVGSSPVALLAWLGEKYRDWTDEELPLDHVLSIATIWWIRDSFPSSIWAYADILKTGISALHNDPSYRLDKPFGYSSFQGEISSTPEAWAGRNGNLQFYSYHAKGGHFAAAEQPEEFAQDMIDCFAKLWPLATQGQQA
ncbi:hypothetical protein JCM10295v2_003744 [Rhodotorula toruloides]